MQTDKNSDLAVEIEALREIYAAINRNDIPGALRLFDPQIERIEPEGFPSAGTYRGHSEMLAHLSQGRATWAEGTCDPEQFIAAGDKIVVFLHVRVRLHNRLDWIEGRFADGFTFRDGKALQMRTFAERQQALDWAGIKVPDAT